MFFLSLMLCLGLTVNVYGQENGFEEPVLLTSAGQSADITIAKILLTRVKLNFTENKLAETTDLKDVKTVVVIAGGSLKGLGAANIDKEKEIKRIEELLTKAKSEGIRILTMHIGGKSRRGSLSDAFCEAAAKDADHLIIVSTGNEDGFFTEIAKSNNIGLNEIKGGALAIPVLKELFNKQ